VTTTGGSPQPPSVHPQLLGAYVMGVLDPAERAGVEEHLAGCETCRREVARLSGARSVMDGVPRAAVLEHLSLGERAEADGSDPTGDLLLRRTLGAVRAERSRGRRVRVLTAAAGVIAVAGLTGLSGALVGRATAPDAPPAAAPATSAPATPGEGRVLRGNDPATGVAMTVTVTPAGDWSRIAVTVEGVAPGTTCRLVAVDVDGRREAAASWIVGTARPGVSRRPVEGSAAVAESRLASVELLDGDGRRLLSLPA